MTNCVLYEIFENTCKTSDIFVTCHVTYSIIVTEWISLGWLVSQKERLEICFSAANKSVLTYYIPKKEVLRRHPIYSQTRMYTILEDIAVTMVQVVEPWVCLNSVDTVFYN